MSGSCSTATGAGPEPPGSTRRSATRAGADKIEEFLGWCEDAGVEVVTLWLLSTDNLHRPADELTPLLEIIGDVVVELGDTGRWRVNPVGALDLLPSETARAAQGGRHPHRGQRPGLHVNVAIGYGGRREIADAVRSLLQEHASQRHQHRATSPTCSTSSTSPSTSTPRGQPDPDLVIRTSGEQRLSGFLLWQSAHSEFYFCEAYWPDFRRVDFLRAIRAYAQRARRFGG